MAKINLSGMTVEALMDLRTQVDEMLVERRAELIEQLERIAVVGGRRVVGGGGSALRGRKVSPNIVALQVRLGPEEERGLGGWLRH